MKISSRLSIILKMSPLTHSANSVTYNRSRHLIFVALFGHEFENCAMGQAAFVEKRADLLGRITCFLNVDGSGSWGWEEKEDTGEILPTHREDKGAISSSSLALSFLAYKSIYHHYRQTPATWMQFPLNFFVSDQYENIGEAGIPTILVISKHIYYHSTLDTMDRITPEHVYRRTLINIDIAQALLDSAVGYYIAVDTNPNRVLKAGEKAQPDLTIDQLPENPTPWQTGPPSELAMHVIPSEPEVFSPVIVWAGFWSADNITHYDAISWKFGGILGLMGSKKGFFGGTMFFLPGKKKISMSITDSQGRTSIVCRKITVRAGRYISAYCAGIAALAFLIAHIVL